MLIFDGYIPSEYRSNALPLKDFRKACVSMGCIPIKHRVIKRMSRFFARENVSL